MQRRFLEAAAPDLGGCSAGSWRLQRRILEAAAPLLGGCSAGSWRLHSIHSRVKSFGHSDDERTVSIRPSRHRHPEPEVERRLGKLRTEPTRNRVPDGADRLLDSDRATPAWRPDRAGTLWGRLRLR